MILQYYAKIYNVKDRLFSGLHNEWFITARRYADSTPDTHSENSDNCLDEPKRAAEILISQILSKAVASAPVENYR